MDESGASYRISPPHHDARAICDHPPKGRRTMTDLSTPREDAAPFPGGAPDQETHDLMHDLSRMQIWATALACGQTPGAREARSEERSGGKECVSTCRTRGSQLP